MNDDKVVTWNTEQGWHMAEPMKATLVNGRIVFVPREVVA